MSKNEITNAIKQICEEKNIPYESVLDTIQQALAAAYRKDFGEKNQNIHTEFNPDTAKTLVFDIKTVVEDVPEEELESDGEGESAGEKGKEIKKSKSVTSHSSLVTRDDETKGEKTKAKKDDDKEELKKKSTEKASEAQPRTPRTLRGGAGDDSKKGESTESEESDEEEKPRFNPRTDIQISDAKKLKKSYKLGDEIKTELKIPAEFGRMAAQTAKQVIIQRLREAERDVLYKEFKEKEGQVISGIIQRREGRLVLIDLGATTAIIPPDQQIETENYNSGQRYRVYISEVRETSKGPEIVVSRTHPEIVKQLFNVEVPEIASNTVEIKALAREAGARSKVAVHTDDDSIDPIGSCVGQRGTRIQTIITELGGEKLDIIQYSDDPGKFITNALSPAKVVSVETNGEARTAKVKVRADQLSLAIGKAGQNVRLAAKLTGWKIDIEEAAVPGAKSEDEETKKLSPFGGSPAGREIKKLRDDSDEAKDKIEDKKPKDMEEDKKDGTSPEASAKGEEKKNESKDKKTESKEKSEDKTEKKGGDKKEDKKDDDNKNKE